MKLKQPLKKSNMRTNHCLSCFEFIETNSIRFLVGNKQFLCKNCLNKRKPKFESFVLDGIKGLSIYEYDDAYKGSLFTLKGCGDIELAKTFLNPYEREISLYYSDYYIIPAPSYIDDDLARGFNHVEEIFKPLKLDFIKIFSKKQRIKQSDLSSEKRAEVINNLEVKNNVDLTGKKILIVDDVMTTGCTIKAMIKLLKPLHPKRIKILVGARTRFSKKHK